MGRKQIEKRISELNEIIEKACSVNNFNHCGCDWAFEELEELEDELNDLRG